MDALFSTVFQSNVRIKLFKVTKILWVSGDMVDQTSVNTVLLIIWGTNDNKLLHTQFSLLEQFNS